MSSCYVAFQNLNNMKSYGIWPIGYKNERNTTFAFRLDLGSIKDYRLEINCANVYKIYADTKFVAFGPNRSAHGYNRTMVLELKSRYITVEAYQIYVKNFNFVMEDPFFKIDVTSCDGLKFTETDFECFFLDDRVRKVQRYSFQRGFEEIYNVNKSRYDLYVGKDVYKKIECEKVITSEILPSYTFNPSLEEENNYKLLESGFVDFNGTKEPVYIRYNSDSNIESVIEGFKTTEVEDSVIPDMAKMEKCANSGYKYDIIKFDRSITGFSKLNIKSSGIGKVYLIFDEMATETDGGIKLDFLRNTTTNSFKWNILKEGEYTLDSFEPYTFNYCMIVYSDNIEYEFSLIKFENPTTKNMYFSSKDNDLNLIYNAIEATLSQNSVDLLTDCPSRERSGWLSDSYFSSVAEKCLTGDNLVEKSFLENYSLCKRTLIPDGMIPMNYPSDDYDGTYIPNWSMWYILELSKYLRTTKDVSLIEKSKNTVLNLLKFFEKYENEYSLLENLESWVFVEWSDANDRSHVEGVNIPSNMCYQKVLLEAYKMYGNEEWLKKSEIIRENIKKLAFDGLFFVDNLKRNSSGVLEKTKNYTEVCQYYGFWFDCLKEEEYEETYRVLMNELGPNRKGDKYNYISKPNVMYGVYMRLDLLMRDERPDVLLNEVRGYFLKMAKITGTLWENLHDGCSLNHAFASYSLKWLVFSLTGYDIEKGCYNLSVEPVPIDTVIRIPLDIYNNKYLEIINDRGRVKYSEH